MKSVVKVLLVPLVLTGIARADFIAGRQRVTAIGKNIDQVTKSGVVLKRDETEFSEISEDGKGLVSFVVTTQTEIIPIHSAPLHFTTTTTYRITNVARLTDRLVRYEAVEVNSNPEPTALKHLEVVVDDETDALRFNIGYQGATPDQKSYYEGKIQYFMVTF